MPASAPARRTFADLSLEEAFNVGYVAGVFATDIRVQRRGDGTVSIMTSMKRELPLEEMLDHARRLANTLPVDVPSESVIG